MAAPITGEATLVNSFTSGDQWSATILALPDGGWLIFWISREQDGSGLGVYGQRYDGGGVPVGGEFRVNSFTSDHQYFPAAALLADGGWVVTWNSLTQDGSLVGVYGQRYSAAGAPVGSEFQVNTTTAGLQQEPAVAALPDGGWVVTWMAQSHDGSGFAISAQRYDSAGAPSGGEMLVNSTTSGDQYLPSIATLADGGWIASWMSMGQDGSGWGVYAQRYSAAGIAVGGEVRVNATTAGNQDEPFVTALVDGGWVVAWASSGQDGSGSGVYTQRFDSSGVAMGGEVQVNATTANDQSYPTLAALSDGGWAVRWLSIEPGSAPTGARLGSIYVQRYDASGAAVGTETLVAATTEDDHRSTPLAALADGGLVVAWSSYGADGSGYGLLARRLAAPDPDAINGTPGDDVLTGTAGDDAINGAGGSDRLRGGRGDDRIDGGTGDDVLTGDQGSDSFIFGGNSGHDRIADFERKDVIVIDVAGVDDFSDLTIATDAQGNAVISWGTGDSITLEGYRAKKLSAADFDFGPPPASAGFEFAEAGRFHAGGPENFLGADFHIV